MASGSLREAKIDGIPFNVAADANVALTTRVEKEAVPHSGGNAIKETLVSGSVEAVKLIVTPSEYDVLLNIAGNPDVIPMSVALRDGSVLRSEGTIKLGPYQSEDFSCEVEFLTTTGIWENFSAS